jgi:hypothetical protein
MNVADRFDRWKVTQARLARAGIAATRFVISDGPPLREEFERYRRSPLASWGGVTRKVLSERDMLTDSQNAGVAYVEERDGAKAIRRCVVAAPHIAILDPRECKDGTAGPVSPPGMPKSAAGGATAILDYEL